jgi:hypothetical protein
VHYRVISWGYTDSPAGIPDHEPIKADSRASENAHETHQKQVLEESSRNELSSPKLCLYLSDEVRGAIDRVRTRLQSSTISRTRHSSRGPSWRTSSKIALIALATACDTLGKQRKSPSESQAKTTTPSSRLSHYSTPSVRLEGDRRQRTLTLA